MRVLEMEKSKVKFNMGKLQKIYDDSYLTCHRRTVSNNKE